MKGQWIEVAVTSSNCKRPFDCGEKDLNLYLRRYAYSNHKKNVAKTFLAVDKDDKTIIGYYSVCTASIKFADVPEVISGEFPKYDMPAFRLARLAVNKPYQNQKFGSKLLLLAGSRCADATKTVGGVALLIDAKNESVVNWYERFEAKPLESKPLSLILPLNSIVKT